jgi:hypothetical protein
VVRLALRSQRCVALGAGSDCERRRHEGELFERRDWEERGVYSSSSMGRARERAAWE